MRSAMRNKPVPDQRCGGARQSCAVRKVDAESSDGEANGGGGEVRRLRRLTDSRMGPLTSDPSRGPSISKAMGSADWQACFF